MKVKLYGYKNCDTCRKASKFLKEKNISFEEIDITTTAPSPAELKSMLEHYEGQVRKLFNTSGVAYKEQQLSVSLPTMPLDKALKLLAGNGRLVKRPFLLIEFLSDRNNQMERIFRSL
jgi:arsenate reductase